MKFSHLEMVQEILSAMESDEVNDIADTAESTAVSLLLRSVYYDLAIDLGLPEHEGLFELNASGDAAKPTLMTVPVNVSKIYEIKYNNKLSTETYANYLIVDFKRFNDFLETANGLRGSTSGVGQMTFTNNAESFEIMYQNDKMPQFYTTVDDYTLIFDSYKSTEDTTLQKSKTMCSGVIYPVYTLSNGFVPDLDPSQFSLLKNRAKVRAFAELKQVENREAASETRRQHILVQKRKRTVPDIPPVLNLQTRYGRRGGISDRIPKSQKQSW